MMSNMLENCKILNNSIIQGDYRKVVFHTEQIANQVKPGQFVHVQIAQLRDRILRRPFSVCDVADNGNLSIVYKIVGEGTEALAGLLKGEVCSILGPLGVPFTPPEKDEIPVIVAGGYGAAATYILAKHSLNKGVLLLGARTSDDIILTEYFEDISFDVRITTEDASLGEKGLVTSLISGVLSDFPEKKLRFYACGPHGMLMAVGQILLKMNLDGELSLDHLMCCGVGACFACVVKVKDCNSDGWRYARTCSEGPVFKASQVYYD